jgi:predicted esterase
MPGINTPDIPEVNDACPDFQDGPVTFSPVGIPPRQVFLWIGSTGGGPLVFWWHGAGGLARNAPDGLGTEVISEITAQGGVVASIESDPSLSFGEWYLNTTDRQDDLIVADLVVACAVQQRHIDVYRIHVVGFSAGGKQAAQMAIRRSGYVASVVLYSGGLFPHQLNPYPPYEDPGNRFPSLVFWGGPSDVVIADNTKAADDYYDFLSRNGNFTVMCDHNGGHIIPPEGPAAAWRFFQDHPWDISPEPYQTEMPSEIPDYCIANP